MSDASATPAEVLATRVAEVDARPDAGTVSGHCKDGPHLRVIAVKGVGRAANEQTFREIVSMLCPNTKPESNPWGAVIAPNNAKQEGMHFLPGGVLYIASWLPTGADEARAAGAGWQVGLQHTDEKKLTTWRLFQPDVADEIGEAAAALCAKHGYTGIAA
jgi:hypothetical protein